MHNLPKFINIKPPTSNDSPMNPLWLVQPFQTFSPSGRYLGASKTAIHNEFGILYVAVREDY